MQPPLNLPAPCVVVLAGPGASGKSSWAAAHFPADWIVSSDRLRAVVGAGEDDIEASADAFVLLEEIVARRLARRLSTVIDTLGLDPDRRRGWLALARRHEMPCIAVAFDTPAAVCRDRNRGRAKPIPANVLVTIYSAPRSLRSALADKFAFTSLCVCSLRCSLAVASWTAQLRSWATVRDLLPTEGFDTILTPAPVRVVPETFVTAPAAVTRQHKRPAGLRFGLHIGRFAFDHTGQRLTEIAQAAESVGFASIYVMDHFRQIPQRGAH